MLLIASKITILNFVSVVMWTLYKLSWNICTRFMHFLHNSEQSWIITRPYWYFPFWHEFGAWYWFRF